MEKEAIRLAIATDLRGKPTRNPASLVPEMARQLNIDQTEILNQIHQMSDAEHIYQRNETSLRLTDEGEQFYFSTRQEKATNFFTKNWPHLTSNLLALAALIVSVFALMSDKN